MASHDSHAPILPEIIKAKNYHRVVHTSDWLISNSGKLCYKNLQCQKTKTLTNWRAFSNIAGSDKGSPNKLPKRATIVIRAYSECTEFISTCKCSRSVFIVNVDKYVSNNWTSYLNPLAFSVWYGFTKLVHRIVKCGENQNASLTPDKEVNILIHGMPLCVTICRNYKRLKMV